jgi:hypothetical protein
VEMAILDDTKTHPRYQNPTQQLALRTGRVRLVFVARWQGGVCLFLLFRRGCWPRQRLLRVAPGE